MADRDGALAGMTVLDLTQVMAGPFCTMILADLRADVVVENWRPGVAARLGVDHETLQPLNPGLIYASVSGFGQTGPYADRPGYDLIAQAMSGVMSITGAPGGAPMKSG